MVNLQKLNTTSFFKYFLFPNAKRDDDVLFPDQRLIDNTLLGSLIETVVG